MKGIILAGGSGSRLYPITMTTSKQLLPVYSKPMIYYPLSTLLSAGIREVLIITTPEDKASFQRLLGDGRKLGIELQYAVQPRPEGLAQAFLIGESFVGEDPVALILGDNLFYGEGLPDQLLRSTERTEGATVFGYRVHDPQRYGVLAFDASGKVSDIVEKPEVPPSSIAVTGLYFYDHHVVEYAKSLTPSARGELEITDLNRIYLERGELQVVRLGRGTAWLDTGTYGSLLQASVFVQAVEQRQGVMVGAIEEAAYRMGYIGADALMGLADELGKNAYATYLRQVAKEDPVGSG